MSAHYEYGDIVISAIDAADGNFHSLVKVNGLKLSPPQVDPYVYRSEQSFSTSSEALRHGIDHVGEHFPPGVPPPRV